MDILRVNAIDGVYKKYKLCGMSANVPFLPSLPFTLFTLMSEMTSRHWGSRFYASSSPFHFLSPCTVYLLYCLKYISFYGVHVYIHNVYIHSFFIRNHLIRNQGSEGRNFKKLKASNYHFFKSLKVSYKDDNFSPQSFLQVS